MREQCLGGRCLAKYIQCCVQFFVHLQSNFPNGSTRRIGENRNSVGRHRKSFILNSIVLHWYYTQRTEKCTSNSGCESDSKAQDIFPNSSSTRENYGETLPSTNANSCFLAQRLLSACLLNLNPLIELFFIIVVPFAVDVVMDRIEIRSHLRSIKHKNRLLFHI